MTELSRRNLLTGAAATVALTTIASSLPVSAEEAVDADQFESFVALSEELTGIDSIKLSPAVDSTRVGQQYFKRARNVRPKAFDQMLQIFEKNKNDPAVANIILNLSGTDIKFLARSIILAWYLGAWYDPALLEKHSYKAKGAVVYYYTARRYSEEALIPFEIISPAAYTQGWVWRVAQAHPMGYGNLEFGYWSKQPPSLEKFIKAT